MPAVRASPGPSRPTKLLQSTDPFSSRYRGETYYGLPPIKSSYYGWLIVAYFFIGGLASPLPFIANIVDLFGRKQDRGVVRAGRYIALLGALISPVLLIGDLHTPRRWYNMLRIYRRTSAMSIGAWALATFGTFTGVVAFGQALDDLFGWTFGRWMARLFTWPAALAGGVVSLYTGTLLAATNIPLWTGGFPYLSSLFTNSAVSTATAALTLAAEASQASPSTRRRLTWLALFASATELFFASLVTRQWRRFKVDAPLQDAPIRRGWRYGVLGLGIVGPLVVHVLEVVRGRTLPRVSALAPVGALVGGFLMRYVFIFAGNASGRIPEDYFLSTQPSSGSGEIVLRATVPAGARS